MINEAVSLFARILAVAGLAGFAVTTVRAQLARPGQRFETEYSFSGKSDVTHGVRLGETSAKYYQVNYAYGFKVGETGVFSTGLKYERGEFDSSEIYAGRLSLPDRIETKALSLAFDYRIDRSWGSMIALSPGYRGADGSTGGKAFTVPVLLGGSYAQSRDLIWIFGVKYDEFSEYEVLPVAAVMWNFAPDWTFSLGFPRTGITYKASPGLKVFANVSMEGGSFFAKGNGLHPTGLINPGEPPYPPTISNTYLDFREIRAGLGLEYALGVQATLEVEGGAVTNRRWDYHKINYTFDGKSTAFGKIAVKFAF